MCSKIFQKEEDICGSILQWTSSSDDILRQSELSVLTRQHKRLASHEPKVCLCHFRMILIKPSQMHSAKATKTLKEGPAKQ